jgi:predicted dehydrogenase/threonine dehydrogenase-like Zn-dependent dehydrogenase
VQQRIVESLKQIEQNYRTGTLRVVDAPAPRAREGTVLVATRASLISAGTERQLVDLAKASLAGKAMARPDLVRQVINKAQREGIAATLEKVFTKLDTPIPLGYSLAGAVIESGQGVQGFKAGDRIACAGAGVANHAEVNAVPKNLCVPVPAGLDDEEASFVTVGAIALQGVRIANPTLGERIVVLGLGLIGLLTVQLLKANGCRVLGFDPSPQRAALARDLGADETVSSGLAEAAAAFTGRLGADAVIVTASTKSSEPVNTAAEISRLKGRVVLVGMVGTTIEREPFYKRELDLRLSMSSGPGRYDPAYENAGHDYPFAYVRWTEQRNMQAFLELVAAGRVTPKALITHRFPIAEAERAYSLMTDGTPHIGIVLTYPERNWSAVERRVTLKPSAPARKGEAHVGFVGFGNYARSMLLPALKAAGGSVLTGVATSTGISARHAAERYGFGYAATDADEVIRDEGTNTLFIATRHNMHASYAVAGLKRDLNVFCEKPLALNRVELADVMSATQSSRGQLTVGFNRRFAPLMLTLKAALQGRSGPLVMLYRVNAGAVPGDSWLQGPEGGGRIIGEICHFVDVLTHLADTTPVAVQAIGAEGYADSVSVLIRMADGSTGTIVYSSLGDPSAPKEYLEVLADGRVIRLDDFRRLTVTARGRTRVHKHARQDKGQRGLVSAFLNAARAGGEPPIPLHELAAVTEATFAIEEAVRGGGVVSVTRYSPA